MDGGYSHYAIAFGQTHGVDGRGGGCAGQDGHQEVGGRLRGGGVVMWEVMSYGERPYWDMSNQDISTFHLLLWTQATPSLSCTASNRVVAVV